MVENRSCQDAEERIEGALRNNVTELDLTRLSLTFLPESISRLTQLQQLNLNGNELTSLPMWISQLTHLQVLYVSWNELTSLPHSIRRLTNLQRLIVRGNQLAYLPESIGKLTHLKELDVSRNGLTSLPDTIGQLTRLRELNVSGNELTSLPSTIGRLTHLQELNVSGNELTSLPESIGKLTKLKRLIVRGNRLTSLPDTIDQLTLLRQLNINRNELTSLPSTIGQLTHLKKLEVSGNKLTFLPESLGRLTQLKQFKASDNRLTSLPDWIGRLKQLQTFYVSWNELNSLPESVGQLKQLQGLYIIGNRLTSLPTSLSRLSNLEELVSQNNLFYPELSAASSQGLKAVLRYLRDKAKEHIVLNEAKLVLVGEGGVGKSCLLAALRGEKFIENRNTTHGVVIKPVTVIDLNTGTEITMNAWDFGGQPLYRPTHQLFFTAPALYLVVWEPRRGPEQSCVDYWIKTIKHRAHDEERPDERPRILVVATHGGPKERQAYIDEQGLMDQFGMLVTGFHHVDSKTRHGIDGLAKAIGDKAALIPSVGRQVPASWNRVLTSLGKRSEKDTYITYKQFLSLCSRQKVSNDLAHTYAAMLNELGYLIHYSDDPTLKDTVILKADWLSAAISFVLEDEQVKEQNGLVEHSRLTVIWNDPERPKDQRYPKKLHPVFLRLMERFDLSYRVAMPADTSARETSLVAQLVPGARPEGLSEDWPPEPDAGDTQRTQVCEIVDTETGRPANAEGILYRLIVRLHRYSLGREDYARSRHWQRGMVLDDTYNGRAFIEQLGGDIRITVRAAYPERLLHHLCEEVTWLIDNFWKGLDCWITVPCPVEGCGGSFRVEALIDSRNKGRPEYPCDVCKEWISIDTLLAKPEKMPDFKKALADIKEGQEDIKQGMEKGFQIVHTDLRRLISQADEQFSALMTALTDESREGPRLFSFEALNPGFFDKPDWISEKFRITLWCEHSKLPLPALTGDAKTGVYDFDIPRDWIVKSAPFLKTIATVLGLVLPVAASATKLAMEDAVYKQIEKQLDFGHKLTESLLEGGEKVFDGFVHGDDLKLEHGRAQRAHGATLRQLHVWLKKKDPGFGGLERVQNKRREFLWIHPRFRDEY